MSEFATNPGSNTAAINLAAKTANEASSTALSPVTTASPTLTPAQTINSIVTASGQTTAQTVTTPTAAALVAALANPLVGTSFDLVIRNENTSSGAITLAAGEGVSLDGTTAVAITKTQLYKGVVTNATAGEEAVTIYGLLTAAI